MKGKLQFIYGFLLGAILFGIVSSFAAITVGKISNPYGHVKGSVSETVTGTGFGATQGSGKVELCDDASCTTSPDQTIGSWSTTSISITTVITGLSDGTIYLRVTHNDATYSQITVTLDTVAPTISGTSTKDEGNNYGILTSMADPPASPSGWATGCKLQGCMEFDGTNDYVEIKESGDLDFSNGSSISIEFWFYMDNVSSNRAPICKRDNNYTSLFCLAFLTTDVDDVRFIYSYSTSANSNYTTSCNCFTTGSWQHIILTYTYGTGSSMVIYRNGSSVSGSWTTGTGDESPLANTIPATIGWSNEVTDKWFDGKIDEVAIWNILLTGATTPTIAQRYNSGNGKELVGNESNLVAVWHFNEAKGTLANDTKKTTLESATVYKYDPIYIDLGTVNGVNGNIQETCLHARWFDSITVKDATGPDDVTSTAMFYDESTGRIKLQAPEAGWPTTDNPLKINISTSLADCAGNVLASSFAMTTGVTSSASIQEGEILLNNTHTSVITVGNVMQSKAFFDGERYVVFYDNGTDIAYMSSYNRTDWVLGSNTLGAITDGRDFDITFGESWPRFFYVCEQNECEAYRWDINTPTTLVNITASDNNCGTVSESATFATTTNPADNKLQVAYIDGGDVYWCRSASQFVVDFSSARTLVQNNGTAIDYAQLESVGSDTFMCWDYLNSGTDYNVECKYWDDSTGWQSVENPVTTAETRSWKFVVTDDYITLLYKKDSDNNIYMKQRGKAIADTWGAESSSIAATVTSCCRLTASALYENQNAIILYYLSSSDSSIVNYQIYDGSSWGGETQLVDTPAGSGLSYMSAPDQELEYPFVVYQYSATPYDVRVSYLPRRSFTGLHNPGSDGELITPYASTNIFDPNFLRFARTANNITCMGGMLHKNRSIDIHCFNNVSYVLLGSYTLSDSQTHFDSHGNVVMALDSDNYLYALYGGRYTSYYGIDYEPLTYRRTSLPITDSSWKPYMWEAEIDTEYTTNGQTNDTCYRGYKHLAITSDGVIHIICQSSPDIYIANNSTGQWGALTEMIDVSCDSTVTTHKTYVFDFIAAPDDSLNLMWSYLDEGNTQGLHLYFIGLTYSGGTYSGRKADKTTSITLPAKPVATGCSGNAAEKIWSSYVDGIHGSGDMEMTDDSYPILVFHEESSSQTYTQGLMYANFASGQAASGSCQENWLCQEIQESGVQVIAAGPSSGRPRSRLNHKRGSQVVNVLYSGSGDLKRQYSPDMGASWTIKDTLVNDATYSLSQANVEDGGSGRDFFILYTVGLSSSLTREVYYKYIDLGILPIIYRTILGN